MILIVCAMESEANKIKETIENIEICKLAIEKYYYKGKINNKNVLLLVTGIGKVNASALTALVLEKEKVKSIVNIGYAGSIKPFKVGDVVIIKDASYHDVDLTSINNLYDYGQIPGMPNPFLSDFELFNKIKKELNFPGVSLFTGDKFITENLYDVKAAYDMEGAAVYQVAYIFKKPAIIIKVISDILSSKSQDKDYNKSEKEFNDLIKETLIKVLEAI